MVQICNSELAKPLCPRLNPFFLYFALTKSRKIRYTESLKIIKKMQEDIKKK